MEVEKNDIILSVSEYLERLNVALGTEAGYVQGEVTEFKQGDKWVGFTLKDSNLANLAYSQPSESQNAVLKCVCNVWTFKRMGVALEDGMEVKVYGTPRISKGWGSLGFWVESVEPVGEGSLKKAYELLRKKLDIEGLFARKRALPEFITRVGVISSRDGVVLQDLRKNLRRLGLRIDFVHTQVEGVGAVNGILRALHYFARQSDGQAKNSVDVVVIIRGGGSLESMQAFNNEEVVRAIFGMPVPVIAGIGHDVDVPLAALAADATASTPTGAAHIINDTWTSLLTGLPILQQNILHAFGIAVYRCKKDIELRQNKMLNYFTQIFRAFDQMLGRLARGRDSIGSRLRQITEQISRAERLLALGNPLRNLRLGYSLTLSAGKVVKRKRDVKIGSELETRVSDGSIRSRVV